MTERQDISTGLQKLIQSRGELEHRLQNEHGELADGAIAGYDREYGKLQHALMQLFRDADEDALRVEIMFEMIRIMENKLVYLQNFVVEPTADNRLLASLVGQFLGQVSGSSTPSMSPLEVIYYRAVAALYAGEITSAAAGFRQACESEESDEANDIKYKSYVILGNLSHEEQDYEKAMQMHERSLQYSQNANVTAQALAFKALNAYALKNIDEALDRFEESLQLFDRDQPFFNSYFYRNALLFCGAIYYQRKDYEKAESFYRQVLDQVQPSSYDHFDALSQLGKIFYRTRRYEDAARSFEQAIGGHHFSENEYLIDLYYWQARTQLKLRNEGEARKFLEKIAASEVRYERRPQAMELLARVS